MTGGVPSNAFAGSPGDWLGLEIDVGLQHHFAFSNWGGMDIGLEAAWLQPGDAFIDATGIFFKHDYGVTCIRVLPTLRGQQSCNINDFVSAYFFNLFNVMPFTQP